MLRDANSNTLFLFCGKRTNRIKGLVWEGDGFLIFNKRVEEGRFSWPRNSAEAKAISPKQFEWLMDGFSIEPEIKLVHPDKSAVAVKKSRHEKCFFFVVLFFKSNIKTC